eukprot:10046139-Karenia_brevis.AAC.1
MNQDARFRRAGVGVYWCEGDPRNVCMPLPGWHQTNQRAELLAVKLVLDMAVGPVEIRSDSQYVVDGCKLHRHKWRSQHWQRLDNKDLWQDVDALLESKRAGSILITKVKGHATREDVTAGFITAAD